MAGKACERYIFHVMAYAIFQNQRGKMGHFKKMNIKKRGISNKMHVINFKRENEPKMKWGISKKKAYAIT